VSARTLGPPDLDGLRAPHTYPAVSVLLPLQRHRPGFPDDPLLLRRLADEAIDRLRRELDPSTGAEIVARNHETIAAVDWLNPAEGLADVRHAGGVSPVRAPVSGGAARDDRPAVRDQRTRSRI
jgi:hypothetical protein